ncbi:hypothetical protein GGI20_003772 [Coemansia sp. BCRC 34301]|nr:hypothetical protein GGI20_003772 [Coemansia sp. BCRC 34301]
MIVLVLCILVASHLCAGLNYTGETALLDAAPGQRRGHTSAVTFGELGVFDFCGDGRARVALELGAFSSEKDTAKAGSSLDLLLQQHRPTRDTDPVELDHVYLIFAKARAVNNFVARLHTHSDEKAAAGLCANVGGWLDAEFVAPISKLRRPPKKKPLPVSGSSLPPQISFVAAPTTMAGAGAGAGNANGGGGAMVTRVVTGLQRRDATPTTNATMAVPTDPSLLGSDTSKNDVFLVEYEWEWLVRRGSGGGSYAVVVANCAATTIQFKYNLIMANRWRDGSWTNLPAGWMPAQQVNPAASYSLWGAAWLWWAAVQARASRRQAVLPLAAGAVPVLRFVSCLADQSRFALWGRAGSYEATLVVVSTSLVDSLADAAHFLCLLAVAKGWGVVRARLVGAEKRLVPGLVAFIAVATLYDGATRGGGVLASATMQLTALLYARAALAHTRHVLDVQTLRLVTRAEPQLIAWWSDHGPGAYEPSRALACLARVPVAPEQLPLVWAAVRKARILRLVARYVVPAQLIDLLALLVASFAVPAHCAYVGLLLAQAAHWLAFVALFAVLAQSRLDCVPTVRLPPLPAIAARRSIPLPPNDDADQRTAPPLGRLRLLRSSAPFADSARRHVL